MSTTTSGAEQASWKSFNEIPNRAWIFRTVGYGHDAKVWKDILSALRVNGYDKTVSIEHEDALMSVDEGVKKAAAFLNEMMIREEACQAWWA